ncbi:MAG: response regulator [Treponema sp.]|nr:response regulator [Treponema sp.]
MEKIIFIIDDNDANLVMASSALEDEYRVLTMPSAQKMFSLLEKKTPDLILLDIEMPDMTGLEAIEKLKDNPQTSGIPVIFLTGRLDENLKTDPNFKKAADAVFKPVNAPVLKSAVKKFIN